METKAFVSDIVWIGRGIAKSVPEKVEIASEELKDLLRDGAPESSGNESEDDNKVVDEKHSLRGSTTDLVKSLDKYKIDDYDDDTKNPVTGLSMTGLAYYASPFEDPYITRHADSEEEEERDDFELKPSDNLVVVAKDEASLDVYVYNENNDDWYLHHDYFLEAPPLCLAPFSYDPGAKDKKGNLIAVGTMDSIINIWDLDIVNSVEPVLTLGTTSIKKKTKKSIKSCTKIKSKKQSSDYGTHTDAVLCLDWNQITDHILASGSADKSIILWDLDETKAAHTLNCFNGMLQSIQWHPVEASVILCGTRKGEISAVDCRVVDKDVSLKWLIGEEFEVERVLWNHFQPQYSFVSSSDGKIRYLDMRKPGEFITQICAHDSGSCYVTQSFEVRNLLTTVGAKELKVWKLENNTKFKHIYTRLLNLGDMNVAKFSPNSGCVVAVGGNLEDLVRILDLSSVKEVVSIFNNDTIVCDQNTESMLTENN